jgi:DNA-binding NarL/FixJ family response regulator
MGYSRQETRLRQRAAKYRDALVSAAQRGDRTRLSQALDGLIVVAVTGRDFEEAARLLGAVHSTGDKRLRGVRASALAQARRVLGEPTFSCLFGSTASLAPPAAVAAVLTHQGRPSARPEAGWESLTSAEWQVAAEVSEGKPNKLIAVDNGVSVETVKTHVRRIFAKLGVRNRTELAVRLRNERPEAVPSGPEDTQKRS